MHIHIVDEDNCTGNNVKVDDNANKSSLQGIMMFSCPFNQTFVYQVYFQKIRL